MAATPRKNPRPCESSPSPSKKNKSIENFMTTLQTHDDDDVDTQLKAALYSLSISDLADIKGQLERIRRCCSAFYGTSKFTLQNLVQARNAMSQKVHSLENHNLILHRENQELRNKVKE